MATVKEQKKLDKALAASMLVLAAIVTATNEGGFMYTSVEIHKPLVDAGLVEVNTTLVNETGEMATRATVKAIAAAQEAAANGTKLEEIAAPAPVEKPTFTLETGVAVPAVAKGGAIRKSAYPFEQMEAGQSFFIAATADRPDPAKSLASTVSGATRKFATEKKDETGATIMRTNRKGNSVATLEITKEFTIRGVEENGVKGARIWRLK